MVATPRPSFFMNKPSIPLGLVFSQSGPYAMMAGEMRKSALMAIDEINQSTCAIPAGSSPRITPHAQI